MSLLPDSYLQKTSSIGLFTTVLIVLFCTAAFAKTQKIEDTTEYQSRFDRSLTLKKVTFLPSIDNVNGVYAKTLDETLEQLIEMNHHWDFVPVNASTVQVTPEDLIGKPEAVLSFSKSLEADGFFVSQLRKDPKQTFIHLYLFSSLTGELITEASLKRNFDNTEIIKVAITSLMARIMEKVPYDAIVMSRIDNRVTINAGTIDGVRPGQNLSAVKIISADKHPKRHFIIKSHKVLLGQVRVVKAEERLSFGDIVSETEPGVVASGAKLTGISKISYDSTPWTRDYTPPAELLSQNNKQVYGKNPKEWSAQSNPTFGKLGAQFGIGSFDNNLTLADGTSFDARNSAYPRITINGEVWITPEVYGDVSFSQGIGDVNDPTSGQDISQSLTQYRFSFGYNFLLRNQFFGPKLSVDIGLSNYEMFTDTTSQDGFTTMQYRSVPIGIGGYVPINRTQSWAIGGKAYFHLFPSLKERPFASAANADSTINQFLFYAENKFSPRLRLKLGLEFLLFSSNFSGQGGRDTPANNTSHRFTLLTSGINYLF